MTRFFSIAVAAVLCAACGSQPKPAAVKPTKPPVTRPLDAGAYLSVDRICALVPTSAIDDLPFNEPGLPDDSFPENPSCLWETPGVTKALMVKVYSERDVLAEAYERPTSMPTDGPSAPVFAGELAVLGQPAAYVLDSWDKEGRDCRIIIGLSGSSGVDISSNGLRCEELQPVAEGVVATLAGA